MQDLKAMVDTSQIGADEFVAATSILLVMGVTANATTNGDMISQTVPITVVPRLRASDIDPVGYHGNEITLHEVLLSHSFRTKQGHVSLCLGLKMKKGWGQT